MHARLSPFSLEGARPLQNGVGQERVTVGGGVCAAAGCHGGPARPHPQNELRAIDPCAVQI